MSILVTGITGEIGCKMIPILSKVNNSEIYVSGRNLNNLIFNKKFLEEKNIKFIEMDLSDEKSIFSKRRILGKITNLIHLAGLVNDSKDVIKDVDSHLEKNIFATTKLLSHMTGLNQIIFASSCSIYGSQKIPINEDSITDPLNIYSASKLILEKLLSIHCKDNNIRLCVLRISSVYSPISQNLKNNRAIQIFAKNIKDKKQINIYGSSKSLRDYIFVDDVVRALLWFNKNEVAGIFNICSGKGESLNSILKILEKISGLKANIFYKERIFENDLVYSAKKAESIGFKTKTTFIKGLEKIYKSV